MNNILIKITLLMLSLTVVFHCHAEALNEPKAQVLMIGTFHFSSPGKDTVKVKHIDVMSKASQEYIVNLTQNISTTFKPTLVLLEYGPKNDAIMQQRYQQFINNNFELPVNEIYQLGFRIAKLSGNVPIASFDEREIGWAAERLFETMPSTAPQLQKSFDKYIKDITVEMNEAHRTLSLKELLQKTNDPEMDKKNKALYLMTNQVSTEGEFEGALASSSWWHRNFRMYAKIQQHAKANSRILVIGGQGHTAILKDFMAIDSLISSQDANNFL